MGAMAITRGSTSATDQVVQPRFDAPATTKFFTVTAPSGNFARKSVTASMARTAALVMGRRAGQRSSPVRRYLSQVYAMMASSVRLWLSPANLRGSLGTCPRSTTTAPVAADSNIINGSGGAGALELLPPLMNNTAMEVVN